MAFDRSLRRAACVLLTAALLVPAWGGLARQVRAAAQSEIDALKAEQAESQVRQEELKEQLADVKEDQAAAQQKRQPYLKLTSAFGYRMHPVDHVPNSHTGIDVAASTGVPIYAARGGQVIMSEYGAAPTGPTATSWSSTTGTAPPPSTPTCPRGR